jgi:LysR family hydrogen peroxide-inducible transcriptional activator
MVVPALAQIRRSSLAHYSENVDHFEDDHDLILTALPVDEDRLTVAPLLHEPLKLVMSAEHRLAKKRRITRQDLAGESVLTIEEHHHFHRQIQQLCDRLGAHVLRDYEGTSLDTLRQMVVMGMGIRFSPARPLFEQLANEVRVLVEKRFSKEVTPISEAHSR